MAIQKTVLKVHLSCAKCKKKLMKAVSEIEGKNPIIYEMKTQPEFHIDTQI